VDFPIENGDFSIATLNYQRVNRKYPGKPNGMMAKSIIVLLANSIDIWLHPTEVFPSTNPLQIEPIKP